MKVFTKIALIAVSLLLPVSHGLAADVKTDARPSPASAMEKGKGTAPSAADKAVVKNQLIDINTATESELKAIPGVGEAFAAKIIAGRPYANKAQLKSRKVLSPLLYEQIKERIIAKQPAKSDKTAVRPDSKK